MVLESPAVCNAYSSALTFLFNSFNSVIVSGIFINTDAIFLIGKFIDHFAWLLHICAGVFASSFRLSFLFWTYFLVLSCVGWGWVLCYVNDFPEPTGSVLF